MFGLKNSFCNRSWSGLRVFLAQDWSERLLSFFDCSLGWVRDLPLDILHYSILLTCLLARTAIETGFLSAVEAQSVQEQARERIRRREWGGEKRQREKEKQGGRSERGREWGIKKGKVRDTVTGEYIAVTADWISGSNPMLWVSFFLLCSLFDDWFLWLDFTAAEVLWNRLQVVSLLGDVRAVLRSLRCRTAAALLFVNQSLILL